MQTVGFQLFRATLAAAAACVGCLLLLASPAAASAACDRVAAVNGSDGNAGTAASPWQTPRYMADHLSAGQTGCFRAGTFDFNDATDVTKDGITLTSYPGERATLKGRLWVFSDKVTVSHLNLDQRSSVNSGPRVNGTDDVFDDDDVTNYNTEICFILGDPVNGPAVRTVIENSRIHNCGKLPAQNGDHGIYASDARNIIIRDNWIYDNADRGIQLYPDSQGAQIYGNVIDGNGEGIIISGDGDTASSGNVIHDNVISDSKVRWNVESPTGTARSEPETSSATTASGDRMRPARPATTTATAASSPVPTATSVSRAPATRSPTRASSIPPPTTSSFKPAAPASTLRR